MENKGPSLRTILLFSWPLVLILGLLLWKFGFSGETGNRAGQKLYTQHCRSCHQADGNGLRKLIPSLQESELVQSNPQAIVCIIKNGIERKEPTAENPTIRLAMTAQPNMDKAELLSLIQYLQQNWGNKESLITIAEIETELENCDK